MHSIICIWRNTQSDNFLMDFYLCSVSKLLANYKEEKFPATRELLEKIVKDLMNLDELKYQLSNEYLTIVVKDGDQEFDISPSQLQLYQLPPQLVTLKQQLIDFYQNLVDLYNPNFLNYCNNHWQSLGNAHWRSSMMLCSINDRDVYDLYDFKDSLITSGGNSGINLKFTQDIVVPAKSLGFKIDFKVNVENDTKHGYLLMPRSSISKTPLRMSNSIGLIDTTYRGNLIATVDNHSSEDYRLEKGASLFQVVRHDLGSQWSLMRVPQLGVTQRGDGGFGSTGK